MKMRKSQQVIFWRNQRVVGLKIGDRIIAWYGVRTPKTAQEIIDDN